MDLVESYSSLCLGDLCTPLGAAGDFQSRDAMEYLSIESDVTIQKSHVLVTLINGRPKPPRVPRGAAHVATLFHVRGPHAIERLTGLSTFQRRLNILLDQRPETSDNLGYGDADQRGPRGGGA